MTIPAKISNEMPLPTPRSVICSPSHMTKMVPVVSVSTVLNRKAPGRRANAVDLEPVGHKRSLNRCQHDGQVTRPLVDLLPAHLAFFLQLLQLRRDDGH